MLPPKTRFDDMTICAYQDGLCVALGSPAGGVLPSMAYTWLAQGLVLKAVPREQAFTEYQKGRSVNERRT